MKPLPTERLISLDQYRGYTVAGMFLVNFLGGFDLCPRLLRHSNDYLSYADTIMPQFLFAVGFAMRLTLGKARQAEDTAAISQDRRAKRGRIVKRLIGLVLVALLVYRLGPRAASWRELCELGWWGAIAEPLKTTWFQTLMHIAVTSLWIVPVIAARQSVRWLWLLGSGILHVGFSAWFYFEWVHSSPRGIDGGPLGFLTWTIPALVGSFACDYFVGQKSPRKFWSNSVAVSWLLALVLMLSGYALSCGTRFYDVEFGVDSSTANPPLATHPVWPNPTQVENKLKSAIGLGSYCAEPPFVPPPPSTERKWNYWMMSQRAGTLSYLVFSAGFSLAVFVIFYWLCDILRLQLPVFRTLGTGALLAYVLHDMVANAIKPFAPRDSPWWYVVAATLLFFYITWFIVRHFEKQNIYVRV